MNKLESVLETIGCVLFDAEITEKTHPEVIKLLDLIGDSYTLVQWPESQD